MTVRILQWGLASLLAIGSPYACAYMEATGIVPNNPVAGQVVSVHMRDGVCDAIIESDGYPIVTQSGENIRILFDTTHETDPVFCNIPEAEGDWELGDFAAGFYTVQVDRRYRNIFGYVIESVGILDFTVDATGASNVAIPTLNGVGLGSLGALVAALAGWRRRIAMKRCAQA